MNDQGEQVQEKPAFPPARDLWQIPGILTAVIIFLVAAYIARSPLEAPPSEPADFEALLMAYEQGDTFAAAESAERYLARHPSAENEPLARFIFADSKWDLIQSDPAALTKDLAVCLDSFTSSLMAGLPPRYEAAALKAKGDILMRMELPNDALDAYTTLSERFPDEEVATLLIACALMETRPASLERAEALINVYLDSDALTPRQIQLGYLAMARLEVSRDEYAGAASSARRVLEAGPDGEVVAQATLVLGRALLRMGDYGAALDALKYPVGLAAGRFEAALVLEKARALRENGLHDEARQALDDAIFRFPGTSEALGGRYLLASFLFGTGQIEAARDALISLLDDMSAQESIRTAWFDIGDVAELWFAVGSEILQKQGTHAVREYHIAALVLMTEGHLLFFDATLYLREAEHLEESVPGLPLPKRLEVRKRIREAYAQAGRIFARVAESASGDIYRQALFNAGHAFFKAGDYGLAIRHLGRFADADARHKMAPQALFEISRSLAELGSYEAAIETCARNATRNPKNLYAYRSILLRGDLYRASGGQNLHDAAAVYSSILVDSRFKVESREWRRAIFSLGETLYLMGRYEEALLRLEEAISRFGDDEEVPKARFYLGLSYRQAGLSNPTLRTELLRRAAETFRVIAARQSDGDARLACKAAFLEADCLYDLGEYEQAISLYDHAAQAYVDTPEATRALFQIASCYWHLEAQDEARATYRRALFNLERQDKPVEPGDEFYRSIARWRGGDRA